METGFSIIETLVSLALASILLLSLASILHVIQTQNRSVWKRFQEIQAASDAAQYLLSKPFSSPLLSPGLHKEDPSIPFMQWRVNESEPGLKQITIIFPISGKTQRYSLVKSNIIQEVLHD